jgi:hypothetical protein
VVEHAHYRPIGSRHDFHRSRAGQKRPHDHPITDTLRPENRKRVRSRGVRETKGAGMVETQ